MIAVLFVLIPGLLGVWLIRRPAQALIPLVIVGLRLWLWKNDSRQDMEACGIYGMWFTTLLCILASRLHPKLGMSVFWVLAATAATCLVKGIFLQERHIYLGGLVVAAVAAFKPFRPPSGLAPESLHRRRAR